MTSASELFHSRRSRISRNEPELGFGSSSPPPFALDRNRRRSRHHNLHRHGENEDSDPSRRSSHSRHLCHREHESVRSDHRAGQSSAGNSSSSGTSSSRANRVQFGRSEQLPGDVLLARERLVERLRGVSLSSNRQSSRLTPGVPWDEYTHSDDFMLVDAGDWEIEMSARWFAGDTPFPDSFILPERQTAFPDSYKNRPPGLNLEEVNHLHHEVFTTGDNAVEVLLECSICLDRFHKGDELICLPCQHKFHSICIYPWVKTCGDCPNCRADIVVKKG